jgi:hypothetical protein
LRPGKKISALPFTQPFLTLVADARASLEAMENKHLYQGTNKQFDRYSANA